MLNPKALHTESELSPRMLNTEQAAAYLGISKKTVYNLTKNGQIISCKIGNSRKYDIQDLENFIQECKQ